ncbi:MAG: hypothetical protein PVSMB8_00380 [Vulcanimicrobiaceae bacterium]
MAIRLEAKPQSAADFGITDDGLFRARRHVFDGERFQELDRRQSWFECTNHDWKGYDWDGRKISNASGASPRIPMVNIEPAPFYVPLRERRPAAPKRLARVIVNGYTNLVFGDGRFPKPKVADSKTQDWIETAIKVTRAPVQMIRARNLAGSMGTVGLSWAFYKGKPKIRVHNAKNLYVHSWEDRDELIPRHVTQVVQVFKEEPDPQRRNALIRKLYWLRRDWTTMADVVFPLVEVVAGQEPVWTDPDTRRSVVHNDGACHLVWVQNKPSDDIDGVPDYDGLYEPLDVLDTLNSVVVRGAVINLDPTLVLLTDPERAKRMGGVKKGSDNALIMNPKNNEDAKYLELAGSSLTVGLSIVDAERKSILEAARCVAPNPDEVAAQGVSSVAIKAMFAPMTGEADQLREQFQDALTRIFEPMCASARAKSTVVVYNDDGVAQIVRQVVKMPPRVEEEPLEDEDGTPTGEKKIKLVPRDPGEGGDIDWEWGPYFPKTPDDQSKELTALSTAQGGTAVLSDQTATEIGAAIYGKDPTEEWARKQKSVKAADDKAADMVSDAQGGGMGGKVQHEHQLPTGAKVKTTMHIPAPGDEDEDEEDGDEGEKPGAKKPPFPPKKE